MQMRKLRGVLAVAALFLGSCTPTLIDAPIVNMRYAHVADVREIRFNQTAVIPGGARFNETRVYARGYWAIFVICSIDVSGTGKTFSYDVRHFRVETGSDTHPYRLTPGAATIGYSDLVPANGVTTLQNAIDGMTRIGPVEMPFSSGTHVLNYRVAILIPRADEQNRPYFGEVLDLSYAGPPPVVMSAQNGNLVQMDLIGQGHDAQRECPP